MNQNYLLYLSERPLSASQRRAVDTRTGELAASISRFGASLRAPVGALSARFGRRPGGLAAPRSLQAAGVGRYGTGAGTDETGDDRAA